MSVLKTNSRSKLFSKIAHFTNLHLLYKNVLLILGQLRICILTKTIKTIRSGCEVHIFLRFVLDYFVCFSRMWPHISVHNGFGYHVTSFYRHGWICGYPTKKSNVFQIQMITRIKNREPCPCNVDTMHLSSWEGLLRSIILSYHF